jgi:hypothetical protein
VPSTGWTSARGEQGDRRLDHDGVHYSVNVNVNRTVSELVIRDEQVPRERRWTSILQDRRTGGVIGIGQGSDNTAAFKAAMQQKAA